MFTSNASPLKLLMQLLKAFREDDMQVGGVSDTLYDIKMGGVLLFSVQFNKASL